MKRPIICRVLTGPTGSGKSEIAFRLAQEENLDILCMDSMQIYRGMNIGTAKPTADEQKAVPHHLLDLCDPRESYSVSQYIGEAEKTVEALDRAGKNVLFVGGTGLYLEGLIHGMSLGTIPANETRREELHALADGPEGRRKLDELLRRLDPVTADKLPLNDVRRRIRAIEVTEATGKPFSKQENERSGSRFRWIVVSTQTEREHLYERINRRVDRMIAEGLEKEVRELLENGVPADAQSMQAIGYKEMVPCIRKEYSLETAAEEIRKGTRHYAKRQMTYLRRIHEIRYVNTESNEAYEQIRTLFRENGEKA